MSTRDRLARTLAHLLTGAPVSTAWLRTTFGVGERTAQRDLQALRDALPLVEGPPHHHRLVDPTLRDAQPTVARAAGLAFAVDALAPLAGSPQHDALRDLALQHREALTDEEQHTLHRLTQHFQVRPTHPLPSTQRPALLPRLLAAIAQQRPCSMTYTPSSGTPQRYGIVPLGLLSRGSSLLLVAGKEPPDGRTRLHRRYFLVDRIRDLRVWDDTDPRQPPRHTLDWPAVFEHAFGLYCPTEPHPETVILHASGPAAVDLAHQPAHPSQTTRPLPDGRLEVTLTVHVCPHLQSWILSLLPHVQVVAPRTLHEALVDRVTRWMAGDGGGPEGGVTC